MGFQSQDESLIFKTQLELAKRAKIGGYVYVLLYSFFLYDSSYFHDHPFVASLILALLTLLAIIRNAMVRYFGHTLRTHLRLWRVNFYSVILINSLIWGLFAAMLPVEYGMNKSVLIMIFATGGIAGGSSASLATAPDLLRLHLVFLIMPLVISLSILANQYSIVLPAMVGLFLTYLLMQSKQVSNDLHSLFKKNRLVRMQKNELEIVRDKALEAARLKSEFLANMSHEIRTPMNGIIGMTNALLDRNLDHESQSIAMTVKECAEDLLSLINDILDFSKVESGKMELEKQSFSIADTIESVFSLLELRAAQKKLKLHYQITSDVPTWIISDSTRFRQILVNLVSNAVKFTEKGSVSVHVTCAGQKGSDYIIKTSVKDTGIGIPEDRLQKLFQSFSQVDASTSRKFGGTGLGLAISKKLSDLLGGKIWVESQWGLGSTFNFTISAPVGQSLQRTPPPLTEKKITPTASKSMEPLQILLAEDNSVNQKLALYMLNKAGYRADVAGNGLEVIEAVKRKDYDVILMDVQMPEMSGLEATQYICQHWPPEKRPWIIGLSANAMKEDRERGLQAGMENYLTKPIEFDALVEALRQAPRPLRQNKMPIDLKTMYDNLGNDHSLLLTLIQIFEKNTPALLLDLQESFEKKNLELFTRTAHSLKGSAANFQTPLVRDLAAQLEAKGRSKDWTGAEDLMKNLKSEYAQLLAELSKLKIENKAA